MKLPDEAKVKAVAENYPLMVAQVGPLSAWKWFLETLGRDMDFESVTMTKNQLDEELNRQYMNEDWWQWAFIDARHCALVLSKNRHDFGNILKAVCAAFWDNKAGYGGQVETYAELLKICRHQKIDGVVLIKWLDEERNWLGKLAAKDCPSGHKFKAFVLRLAKDLTENTTSDEK